MSITLAIIIAGVIFGALLLVFLGAKDSDKDEETDDDDL